MIIYYIRHGNPTYTPDELTPLGRRQAEAVCRRIATYGVDEIYASTSTRAMQTAEPLCEILGKELTTLDWMHEKYAYASLTMPYKNGKDWIWSHPEYSALLCSREIRNMGERWYEHPKLAEGNFGEAVKRVADEADKWIASFGYEHDTEKGLYKITSDEYKDKRIALFAHEGVGKAFLRSVLDIPYPALAAHIEMQQSGMTVIYFDEGSEDYNYGGYARARVLTVSNDSHLYRAGLPTDSRITHIKSLKY